MIKIASWNVNSITIRLEQILYWIEQEHIDILCIQETKLTDDKFPQALFLEHGYNIAFSGQKSYNGVAIISRYPINNIVTDFMTYNDPQRRIIAASIADLRVINFYVPNGSAIDSDKYHYKLHWLKHAEQFIQTQLNEHSKVIVMGDFNIAPEDNDVYDPLEYEVMVSHAERQAFQAWLNSGLYDSFRLLYPNTQTFSWWDYRAGAFYKNHGLRIDHILVSEALKTHCVDAAIDKTLRHHKRPSDHAPVWLKLQLILDS